MLLSPVCYSNSLFIKIAQRKYIQATGCRKLFNKKVDADPKYQKQEHDYTFETKQWL